MGALGDDIHALQLDLAKDPDGTICCDCGSTVAHRYETSACKRCHYKGGDQWVFARMLDIDQIAAVLMVCHGIERPLALAMAGNIFIFAKYEGGQDCS